MGRALTRSGRAFNIHPQSSRAEGRKVEDRAESAWDAQMQQEQRQKETAVERAYHTGRQTDSSISPVDTRQLLQIQLTDLPASLFFLPVISHRLGCCSQLPSFLSHLRSFLSSSFILSLPLSALLILLSSPLHLSFHPHLLIHLLTLLPSLLFMPLI